MEQHHSWIADHWVIMALAHAVVILFASFFIISYKHVKYMEELQAKEDAAAFDFDHNGTIITAITHYIDIGSPILPLEICYNYTTEKTPYPVVDILTVCLKIYKDRMAIYSDNLLPYLSAEQILTLEHIVSVEHGKRENIKALIPATCVQLAEKFTKQH